MLQRKIKFIAVPLAILVLAVSAAPLTLYFWPTFHPTQGATFTRIRMHIGPELINPFVAMVALFVGWNIYHFGSQNFGVWRLWRRGRGNRLLQKVTWVSGTAAGIVGTPIVAPILVSVSVWTFGLSHWLVAIGLAARVSQRPILFWMAMLLLGIFLTASLWAGITYGSLLVAMIVVGLRVGIGFDHFLYDRWSYKFSDPKVRGTIGRDIFELRSDRQTIGRHRVFQKITVNK